MSARALLGLHAAQLVYGRGGIKVRALGAIEMYWHTVSSHRGISPVCAA